MHWVTTFTGLAGVKVSSPATGVVLPLAAHPDLLYNANVLAQALCIELQHGTLYSPFAAKLSYGMQYGRRLCFQHHSGLLLQIELPDCVDLQSGSVIRHLVSSEQHVESGQAVVKLDLQQLQHNDTAFAVLMVMPHPAITAVWCKEGYVTAKNDTALLIQLKNR